MPVCRSTSAARRHLLLATALLFCWIPLSASAVPIFESASLGSPSTINQGDVSGSQSFGVRFELGSTMTTTEIGGHFKRVSTTGNQSIYGAVVALTSSTDFPNSTNMSTSDVLGSALLGPLTDPSSELVAPLSLVLTPGWYALVFGSGNLGASGFGGIPRADSNIGSPDYFRQTLGTWTEANPATNQRYFLNGLVPEPGTGLLVATGLTLLAGLRGRVR